MLKHVKAIGWFVKEYGIAQVSMNLTNIEETPLHAAFDACFEAASKRGLRVTGSEIVGLVAGFGTTFAALPDLIAMLRRRSSAGVNPRMATIMGAFQILWVYYGLLIASRPVIIWNVIAVFVNFINVCAYLYFVRKERHS